MHTANASASVVDRDWPRTRARIAGAVYLLFFLTAIAGAIAAPTISGLGGLSNDATGVARYIRAHGANVQAAAAFALLSTALYVALIGLLYGLLRPVNTTMARLAVLFGTVGNAVTAFGIVLQLAPVAVLGDSYMGPFSAQQRDAMSLLLLHLSAQAGTVALIFFGSFQLALGYLIFRATFLPRVIGALVAAAGVGWLFYLAPPVANALMTYLEVLGFVAEASLMLWLLVRGVNGRRWIEVARASSTDSMV